MLRAMVEQRFYIPSMKKAFGDVREGRSMFTYTLLEPALIELPCSEINLLPPLQILELIHACHVFPPIRLVIKQPPVNTPNTSPSSIVASTHPLLLSPSSFHNPPLFLILHKSTLPNPQIPTTAKPKAHSPATPPSHPQPVLPLTYMDKNPPKRPPRAAPFSQIHHWFRPGSGGISKPRQVYIYDSTRKQKIPYHHFPIYELAVRRVAVCACVRLPKLLLGGVRKEESMDVWKGGYINYTVREREREHEEKMLLFLLTGCLCFGGE